MIISDYFTEKHLNELIYTMGVTNFVTSKWKHIEVLTTKFEWISPPDYITCEGTNIVKFKNYAGEIIESIIAVKLVTTVCGFKRTNDIIWITSDPDYTGVLIAKLIL